MSAEEESFIVLDETPSMLQFSLLDSLTLNSEKDLENNHSIDSNINTNRSVNNDHTSILTEPSMKFDNKIKSTDNDLSFVSLNAESISSVMTQNHQEQSRSPPKTTLAQSFLLGDINCDKMKVIFMMYESDFKFINHHFVLLS